MPVHQSIDLEHHRVMWEGYNAANHPVHSRPATDLIGINAETRFGHPIQPQSHSLIHHFPQVATMMGMVNYIPTADIVIIAAVSRAPPCAPTVCKEFHGSTYPAFFYTSDFIKCPNAEKAKHPTLIYRWTVTRDPEDPSNLLFTFYTCWYCYCKTKAVGCPAKSFTKSIPDRLRLGLIHSPAVSDARHRSKTSGPALAVESPAGPQTRKRVAQEELGLTHGLPKRRPGPNLSKRTASAKAKRTTSTPKPLQRAVTAGTPFPRRSLSPTQENEEETGPSNTANDFPDSPTPTPVVPLIIRQPPLAPGSPRMTIPTVRPSPHVVPSVLVEHRPPTPPAADSSIPPQVPGWPRPSGYQSGPHWPASDILEPMGSYVDHAKTLINQALSGLTGKVARNDVILAIAEKKHAEAISHYDQAVEKAANSEAVLRDVEKQLVTESRKAKELARAVDAQAPALTLALSKQKAEYEERIKSANAIQSRYRAVIEERVALEGQVKDLQELLAGQRPQMIDKGISTDSSMTLIDGGVQTEPAAVVQEEDPDKITEELEYLPNPFAVPPEPVIDQAVQMTNEDTTAALVPDQPVSGQEEEPDQPVSGQEQGVQGQEEGANDEDKEAGGNVIGVSEGETEIESNVGEGETDSLFDPLFDGTVTTLSPSAAATPITPEEM